MMKNKILFIAILMIALLAFAGASAEEIFTSEEGFTWRWADVDSLDPCAEIVGFDKEFTGEMVVPSYLDTDDGYVYVNSIADYAFQGCAMSYASIGSNIWYPGEGMFMDCKNLAEVYYEPGVHFLPARTFKGCENLMFFNYNDIGSIGEEAFMGCTSLEEVYLYSYSYDGSSDGPVVGASAFEGCTNLYGVYFQNSWSDIYPRAFADCTSLKIVRFDETDVNAIDNISNNAFTGCSALKKILLPRANFGFEQHAFAGCDNLTVYVFSDSYALSCAKAFGVPHKIADVTDEETGLIYMLDDNDYAAIILGCTEDFSGALVIPDELDGYPVEQIAKSAFAGNQKITSVTVPDSVWMIGDYAFCNTNITEANMPDWLEWGPFALFKGCEKLVTVNGLTDLESIEDCMFYDCVALENYDIPADAYYIGSGAFGNCVSLKTLTLPVSLEEISWDAFDYCENLKLLVARNSVGHQFAEDYGFDYDFYDSTDEASGLQYIVKSGNAVIIGCSDDVSGALTIPETIGGYTVTAIARSAFAANSSITTVTVPGTVTEIGSYAFSESAIESITLPPYLYVLGDSAFEDCEKLHTVSGLESLYELMDSTFRNCVSLKNIVLPEDLYCIYSDVFYGCASLESLILPAGMQHIDGYSFLGCEKLKLYVYSGTAGYEFAASSDFPYELMDKTTDDGIVYAIIGGKAVIVSYTDALPKNVVIPDELDGYMVTTINEGAFKNAPIDSITVSENVSDIGMEAFAGSTLKKAVLPESVNEFSGRGFADCRNLTEVNFPDGIGYVAFEMFENCTGLKEVTLHEGLSDIYTGAFRNCTTLEKVYIPESISYIVPDVFDNCSKLTLHVYENSYAHDFAVKNSIRYQLREGNAITQIYGMPELTYLPVGISFEPSLKFAPEGIAAPELTFVSSDPSVVSVNGYTLTTLKNGTSKITVSGGDQKLMFFIEVGDYPTLKLPANATTVDAEAFIGCEDILIIDMRSNNGIELGENAFANTPSLTTILLPNIAYIYPSTFDVNGNILFLTPNPEEVTFYKSYGYCSGKLSLHPIAAAQ